MMKGRVDVAMELGFGFGVSVGLVAADDGRRRARRGSRRMLDASILPEGKSSRSVAESSRGQWLSSLWW